MANTEVELAYSPNTVEIQTSESTVEVTNNQPIITTQVVTNTIETQVPEVSVIAVGIQGAQGLDGSNAADPPYRQYDIVGNVFYKGWSDYEFTNTPTWRIMKGTEVSLDNYLYEFADGNSALDNIWADRYSLTYL